MTRPMTTAPPTASRRDGLVLATDEGDRALEDRPGDVLHRLRPGVGAKDVPGEVEGEGDRGDPGERDHPQ